MSQKRRFRGRNEENRNRFHEIASLAIALRIDPREHIAETVSPAVRWGYGAPSLRGAPIVHQRNWTMMMSDKDTVYDEPSKVRAVDGQVDVKGPDAVDVTLSPEAAEETSERLLTETFKARGQRRLRGYPHQPSES